MTDTPLVTIFKILITIGMLALLPVLKRGKRSVVFTTLLPAWWMLALAVLAWFTAWITTALFALLPPAVADQAWYGIAVLMLCPLVWVLGARRPVTRVWPWFVIVPLVLVLSIPLVTTWTGGTPFPRLQIETPALLGYVLVLVMGTGNYFGTRFTFSTLILGAALLLLVVPLSTVGLAEAIEPDPARIISTGLVVAAGLIAGREGKVAPLGATRIDSLWHDFRDYFGIVWAERLRARVRETGEAEKWSARLEMVGLVPLDRGKVDVNSPVVKTVDIDPEVVERAEHTLRWLLRRFAEPAWIEERLNRPLQSISTTQTNDAETPAR